MLQQPRVVVSTVIFCGLQFAIGLPRKQHLVTVEVFLRKPHDDRESMLVILLLDFLL
jgi:hypothetical protein